MRFGFSHAQVEAWARVGKVAPVATHPAYEARTELSGGMGRGLLDGLLDGPLGATKALPMG